MSYTTYRDKQDVPGKAAGMVICMVHMHIEHALDQRSLLALNFRAISQLVAQVDKLVALHM